MVLYIFPPPLPPLHFSTLDIRRLNFFSANYFYMFCMQELSYCGPHRSAGAQAALTCSRGVLNLCGIWQPRVLLIEELLYVLNEVVWVYVTCPGQTHQELFVLNPLVISSSGTSSTRSRRLSRGKTVSTKFHIFIDICLSFNCEASRFLLTQTLPPPLLPTKCACFLDPSSAPARTI